jgi:epoxyqueuosine reductase
MLTPTSDTTDKSFAARLTALVRAAGRREGFDAVGIGPATLAAEIGERLATALADGHHGAMSWLADTADRRKSPTAMWPAARSAVVLAISYGPERDPLSALGERGRGVIASYAKGRDYHDVVKGKLKAVAAALARAGDAEVKVFVDTAPLMEKPLAAAAGLGWQGKHTNLVSRQHGSWLLLGTILTDATLVHDAAETDHCGSCRRCLDVCPTSAFPAPYRLDARRCISYLTIEHPGHIPIEFRAPIGNRIFGCDDCLAVCPWNKYATIAREAKLRPRAEIDDPPLGELLALDDATFRARFAASAIKRTGRARFVRNVLIAAGNSGDAALVPAVERLLGDASGLVRAMAVWSLGRLAGGDRVRELADRHLAVESDPAVRAEWERSGAP